MRIGVLTGGGDCPGLNAVIRAVIRKGEGVYGHSLIGYKNGWKGVVEGTSIEMSIAGTRGLLHRGGTILGTSRLSPSQIDNGADKVKATMAADNVDALIVIGGEGTMSGATAMSEEGINIVGVPKTIDNDINATDVTFGFHTAVQIATDAIDRLHTTAESHDRVMVVEVMGRHAGWIAAYSGIAGGADVILVPEKPFDIDKVCDQIKRRHARGVKFSIIVVAEGSSPIDGTMKKMEYEVDQYGHQRLGGIGYQVAREIETRTGFETRETSLGHVLRG
ncbi:MAG TPA: ATP-dependent 6-phosphofructokinase, partial [Acidimicrobiia bacterium]|nr:ATP-dependent 6-phosphofructokinase [Acidimicrobiia bacterium]